MKYRLGKPFWRFAYKLGATIYYKVVVRRDPSEGIYYAASSDIPCLLAEGNTIQELIENIKECVALLARQYYPEIKNPNRLILRVNLQYVKSNRYVQRRRVSS